VRVYIGIPINGGAGAEFISALLKTRVVFDRLGWEVEVDFHNGCSILTKARNEIVRRFLSSGFDVLLFIDSDMVWSPIDAVKLLRLGKDFTAIAYRTKTDELKFNCVLNGEEENGLMGADATGTGLMALRRECLAKMVENYQQTAYEDSGTIHALFDFEIHQGRYWGEDYTFCRRWKAIGGDIWLLPADIGHVGPKNYKGNVTCTLDPSTR
jgi:hypothetical protein